MRNKSVSCLIPTYNGKHLLEKHLPSVLAATRNGDEIVIVDDASTDDTVRWLSSKYSLYEVKKKYFNQFPAHYAPKPSLKNQRLFSGNIKVQTDKSVKLLVIQNKANVRFAGAVNAAIPWCQHEKIFLINNDVEVSNNCIDVLSDAFDSEPLTFGIGCLEYEHDQSGEKSGKNQLWFEKGLFQHAKADNFFTGDTAWVSGGSGMFSKAKWLEIKGFDLVFYPAYWEDIDLSFRARKVGWKVWFCEDAVVIHQHESTNAAVLGRTTIEEISWKNARKFTRKHATFTQLLSYYFWYPYWQLKRWQQ